MNHATVLGFLANTPKHSDEPTHPLGRRHFDPRWHAGRELKHPALAPEPRSDGGLCEPGTPDDHLQ